jgi:hypothetical protein
MPRHHIGKKLLVATSALPCARVGRDFEQRNGPTGIGSRMTRVVAQVAAQTAR